MPKSYILCTNFAGPCSPSSLELGHILDNPFDPAPVPRNADCRVPIPASDISPPLVEAGFTAKRAELVSGEGEGGSGAPDLLVGLLRGVDAHSEGGEEEGDGGSLVRIEKLETAEFEPSAAYVLQSVAGRSVRDDVEGREGQAVLYMVTGIKVARGVSIGRAGNGTVRWSEPMDLVLAIRVCKVCGDEWDVDTRHAGEDGEAMSGGGGGEGRRTVEVGGDLTMKDLEVMLGEEYSVIEDAKEGIRWIA